MADPQGKVLHVRYSDKPAVYNCYMPFCKDGGIFVPSTLNAPIGSHLFLLVELPENKDTFMVSGKVGWINPGRRKGVGIRLNPDEQGRKLRNAIENLLGGSLKSLNPTYTM